MSPNQSMEQISYLREDNYFVWEFNARMKLAKKNLHDHIDVMKLPREMDEEWKVKDVKAFAIIATMVSPNFQTMIRSATSAAEAWEILKNFFVRRNTHNRVQMRRKIHEFKMGKGSNILEHLMKFDELCSSMEAISDGMDQDEQLIVLLGSLSADYDSIVKIIENIPNIDMMQAKEMIHREYESLRLTESNELALRATKRNNVEGRGKYQQRGDRKGKFNGKCFNCGRLGHRFAECRQKRQQHDIQSKNEHAFMASNDVSSTWLLDSGASSHMSPFEKDFTNIQLLKTPIIISIANGVQLSATKFGNVSVMLENNDQVKIHDVLLVPGLDHRLLSVSALVAKGLEVNFENEWCTIRKNKEMVTCLKKSGKLYLLQCKMTMENAKQASEKQDARLWHARLGHIPMSKLKMLTKCVDGINIKEIHDDTSGHICEACTSGKMTVESFPKSKREIKSSNVLEIVHSDIIGPMEIESFGGSRYIVTFIDDYSRYVVAYFIVSKSEVYDKFIDYKALMENQLDTKIKCIRTDNGGEYINKKFASLCRHAGIIHQTTVPYSPQQNGLAERMNRTLMERAKSMMAYKNVDKKWWAEAVNTAVYVTNRVLCSSWQNKTPIEVCFGKRPDLSNLIVFGSTGFAHIDKSQRKKLDNKSFSCIFVRYSSTTKGYRVINTKTQKLIIVRSATFHEAESPKYIQVVDVNSRKMIATTIDCDHSDDDSHENIPQSMHTDVVMEDCGERSSTMELQLSNHPEPISSSPEHENDNLMDVDSNINFRDQQTEIVPRGRFDEYDDNIFGTTPRLQVSERNQQLALPNSTNSNALVPYEKDRNEKDHRSSKRYRTEYEQANAALEEPSTYQNALNSPEAKQWSKAIQAELTALEEKSTWTVMKYKPGQKVIGTKWVFTIKRNDKDEIQRFKARLVALGYKQTPGVDYLETYSPVANLNSIRVFLSLCCHKGYYIQQYDGDTAFLNGFINEDVYIWPPEGISTEPDDICKLNRSLYGLKQAAITWYKMISNIFVVKLAFTRCKTDSCIFVRKLKIGFAYIALYVDDMLIGAPSLMVINDIILKLKKEFKMKTLGQARFVLGIEIKYNRNEKEMHISQSACILRWFRSSINQTPSQFTTLLYKVKTW